MFPSQNRGFLRATDALSDDAPEDPYTRWLVGFLGALAVAAIGGWSIASRFAYCVGFRPPKIVEYTGTDAVCVGVAVVAVGLFLHGHYFWSQSYRFYFVSEILKPVSLLIVSVAIGYLLVNQIVFA